MSQDNQTEYNEKHKCSKFKILNLVLMIAILAATITSAYYSYNTNRMFVALINGIQPGAAQAAPAASNDSITKKYAKNRTLEKAQKTGKPIVVFFYADWCGYCKRFAPTFDKITKNSQIKSNMSIAYVNCEAPENIHLIEEYKIQGFPTVYLINSKSGEKEKVDNNELFTPTAEKDLVDKFLKFSNK